MFLAAVQSKLGVREHAVDCRVWEKLARVAGWELSLGGGYREGERGRASPIAGRAGVQWGSMRSGAGRAPRWRKWQCEFGDGGTRELY